MADDKEKKADKKKKEKKKMREILDEFIPEEFLLQKQIQWRLTEIEKLEYELINLRVLYQDCIYKKELAYENLIRTVATAKKKFLDFDKDCQEEEAFVYRQVEEEKKRVAEDVEKVISIVNSVHDKLTDLLNQLEKKQEVVQYFQQFAQVGQYMLESFINDLQDKVDRLVQDFEENKEFLRIATLRSRKTISSQLAGTKQKIQTITLDFGIDTIPKSQLKALGMRQKVRDELLIHTIQLNNFRKDIEMLCSQIKIFGRTLNLMKNNQYDLVPLPVWPIKKLQKGEMFNFPSRDLVLMTGDPKESFMLLPAPEVTSSLDEKAVVAFGGGIESTPNALQSQRFDSLQVNFSQSRKAEMLEKYRYIPPIVAYVDKTGTTEKLESFEYGFRVPLTFQTILNNYKVPSTKGPSKEVELLSQVENAGTMGALSWVDERPVEWPVSAKALSKFVDDGSI